MRRPGARRKDRQQGLETKSNYCSCVVLCRAATAVSAAPGRLQSSCTAALTGLTLLLWVDGAGHVDERERAVSGGKLGAHMGQWGTGTVS